MEVALAALQQESRASLIAVIVIILLLLIFAYYALLKSNNTKNNQSKTKYNLEQKKEYKQFLKITPLMYVAAVVYILGFILLFVCPFLKYEYLELSFQKVSYEMFKDESLLGLLTGAPVIVGIIPPLYILVFPFIVINFSLDRYISKGAFDRYISKGLTLKDTIRKFAIASAIAPIISMITVIAHEDGNYLSSGFWLYWVCTVVALILLFIPEDVSKYLPNNQPKDNIHDLDILKKYKELLDIGAINQEEFEKVKTEILSNTNPINNDSFNNTSPKLNLNLLIGKWHSKDHQTMILNRDGTAIGENIDKWAITDDKKQLMLFSEEYGQNVYMNIVELSESHLVLSTDVDTFRYSRYDPFQDEFFNLRINDQEYRLPVSVTLLTQSGWVFNGNENDIIAQSSYLIGQIFEKNGVLITTQLYNPTSQEIKVTDSYVGYIKVCSSNINSNTVIQISKGITLNKSTSKEVTDAFGEPSDILKEKYGTTFTYKNDLYSDVELKFNTEDIINEICIRNMIR